MSNDPQRDAKLVYLDQIQHNPDLGFVDVDMLRAIGVNCVAYNKSACYFELSHGTKDFGTNSGRSKRSLEHSYKLCLALWDQYENTSVYVEFK